MTLPRIARVECDGFDYSVFATGDFLSQQVLLNGTWGKLQHGLSGLLLQGFDAPVVVDVGANFGLYAIPVAAMAAKSGGRLLAFEPQRIVFQQLCANIFANRLDCVWAFNQAVGAEAGSIEIPAFDYARTANIGAFSIDKDLQKMRGLESGVDREHGESVAITTLDSLQVDGRVRCVKIDVEGMEIDVIRGGRHFLEEHGFPPLIFEAWESDWFTEKRKALFAEVSSLGYETTKLARDEFLAQHPGNEARIIVQADRKQITRTR